MDDEPKPKHLVSSWSINKTLSLIDVDDYINEDIKVQRGLGYEFVDMVPVPRKRDCLILLHFRLVENA